MRVRRQTTISLTLTEFDDAKCWGHVGVQKSGEMARTTYQTRTTGQLSQEELDLLLVHLDELSQTWVNRWRRAEPGMFPL